MSSIYYGAKGYKIVGEAYDKTIVTKTCEHIKKNFKLSQNLEAAFNAFSTWTLLSCPGKLESDADIKVSNMSMFPLKCNVKLCFFLQQLVATVESEKSSVGDIRYALEIFVLTKTAIPNSAKLAQLLKTKLKEDDSLQSLGQFLHAASLLGNAGKFALDHVEDVVVQADEIDGKLLQWEGGLSVTSLLVTGLLRLPGSTPFKLPQAEKLANYLLTRTTVQAPKGILALLEAIQALSSSSVSPVSITIVGNGQVTVDKPQLTIQVSNILGQSLKLSSVIAESVKKLPGNSEILSKQSLSAGSNPTQFVLNLKVDPGYYSIALSAGTEKTTLKAKVLGPIAINSLEVGLSDADGSSAPKMSKLSYPSKLSSKLQADSSQQLIVKFSISRPVHQAFLRLYSSNKEILFVAEQDTSKAYKIEVNLASELVKSDIFDMELILGDAIISNPIRWVLGTIDVNLGVSDTQPSPKIVRGPKPEIKHLFRQPEKRPVHWVPMTFCGLTLVPYFIVLYMWGSMGLKLEITRAISLPFHFGFLLVFLLYYKFWMHLDMFTTCAYLVPVGAFLFLVGYRMLSYIGRHRDAKKSDK